MSDASRRPTVAAARRRGDAAIAGHLSDEPTARSLLGDPDPEVRATALGALARMGRAEAPDAAAALEDRDPHVRRYAC